MVRFEISLDDRIADLVLLYSQELHRPPTDLLREIVMQGIDHGSVLRRVPMPFELPGFYVVTAGEQDEAA
jgi:hypothetical protein